MNIVDMLIADKEKIEEMVNFVDGVLSNVAYGGMEYDKKYIRDAQSEFKKRFKFFYEKILEEAYFLKPAEHIADACNTLLDLYLTFNDAQSAREDALNALQANIIMPPIQLEEGDYDSHLMSE